MYLSYDLPCAIDTYEIAGADADPIAMVQQLAAAVKDVISITGVAYNPSTGIATFGFCDEQTTDGNIGAALKAASIDAKIIDAASEPLPDNILVQ
jgi:hypothetical protein